MAVSWEALVAGVVTAVWVVMVPCVCLREAEAQGVAVWVVVGVAGVVRAGWVMMDRRLNSVRLPGL